MLPSYIQSALYGARGYLQVFCNPFHRMPMHVKTYHYLPVDPGQIAKRPADGFQLFGGIVVLNMLLGNLERMLIETYLGVVVLFPEPVAVLVGEDGEEPCPQVVGLLPPGKLADSGQEGLLGDVLRHMGVPGFVQCG